MPGSGTLSLLPHSDALSSGAIRAACSPHLGLLLFLWDLQGPVSVSLGSSPVAPASFAQPGLPEPPLHPELPAAPTHLVPIQCPQGGWAQHWLGIAALPTDARAALGMPGRRGGRDESTWENGDGATHSGYGAGAAALLLQSCYCKAAGWQF